MLLRFTGWSWLGLGTNTCRIHNFCGRVCWWRCLESLSLHQAKTPRLVAFMRYRLRTLLIVLALGLLCGCRDRQGQRPPPTLARARLDENYGKEAVEAAKSGNLDRAEECLLKIQTIAIRDDYAEASALELL